jgi:hypothetical protein
MIWALGAEHQGSMTMPLAPRFLLGVLIHYPLIHVLTRVQLLYYLKRRSSVKENHLKRRWPRRGLIREQKDFVFVVLKGGIVNTNALRQSNVMLFKSCWSFSIWNISTHCLCLLKCRSSYLWLFLGKLLLARRVLVL